MLYIWAILGIIGAALFWLGDNTWHMDLDKKYPSLPKETSRCPSPIAIVIIIFVGGFCGPVILLASILPWWSVFYDRHKGSGILKWLITPLCK